MLVTKIESLSLTTKNSIYFPSSNMLFVDIYTMNGDARNVFITIKTISDSTEFRFMK